MQKKLYSVQLPEQELWVSYAATPRIIEFSAIVRLFQFLLMHIIEYALQKGLLCKDMTDVYGCGELRMRASRITLECIVKRREGVDFASFTNFREAGNEPSGFIEVEEFF
jgi:hypothetical protein